MQAHMNQAIFNLKASVPATSLYLLICSMLDDGRPPTLDTARRQWTGTEEKLHDAIDELTRRGVLQPLCPGEHGKPAGLFLTSHWRKIV